MEQTNQTLTALTQTAPHPRVSERYKFVSTQSVIDAMQSRGFEVQPIKRSRSQFGLHILRFRHPDLLPVQIGESMVTPELIFKNSHDGTAAAGIIAGAFRAACFNGLILGVGYAVRMIHTGDINKDIAAVIPDALNLLLGGIDTMKRWSSVQLTLTQQKVLAARCLQARFSDETLNQSNVADLIDQVITPQRDEDRAPDLFTVFNRIQERLVRGAFKIQVDGKFVTVRKISGARATIKINQHLSEQTESVYAMLTGGAQ